MRVSGREEWPKYGVFGTGGWIGWPFGNACTPLEIWRGLTLNMMQAGILTNYGC